MARSCNSKTSGMWGSRGIVDGDPGTLSMGWHVQAQHEIAACGVDHAPLGRFQRRGVESFKKFRIERSMDGSIKMIVHLDSEFMAQVQSRTPPAEFEAADVEHMRRYFPDVTEEALVLTALELESDARSCTLQGKIGEIERWEDIRDTCKAKLLMAMGNSRLATVGDHTLTRKHRSRKTRAAACRPGLNSPARETRTYERNGTGCHRPDASKNRRE